MRIVIIGSGVTGAVLADMLKARDHDVLILEKESTPGGMAKSFYKGGFTYEYGPHILGLHHGSTRVKDYILSKIDVIDTTLTSASWLQGRATYYPPSLAAAERLGQRGAVQDELSILSSEPDETNFETYLLSKVGPTLYSLFFRDFTRKFWGVEPKTLSAEWAKLRRLGDNLDMSTGFYNERWCSYPKTDWNELFHTLLKGQQVLYDAQVERVSRKTNEVRMTSGDRIAFDLLISTLSIDDLFHSTHMAPLAYAGYSVTPMIIDRRPFMELDGTPIAMIYYPEAKDAHCRITDHGVYQQKTQYPYDKRSIITVETPDPTSRLYPFFDDNNEQLLNTYLREAAQHPNIITCGRLGLYKYLTVDTTVEMICRLLPYIIPWKDLTPDGRYAAYQEIRGCWNN